jgi:hypothetical protein
MPDIPTSAAVSAVKAASKIRPWATVKRHDRLLRHEYEDLMIFAKDELQVEARATADLKNDLASRGILDSGAYSGGLIRAHNESAKKWRDYKRTSDRRIEEMREAEGVAVRAWRAASRKPWPVNPDAAKLLELTRAWEDEATGREVVEREVAPQVRAEQQTAVWFFPEERVTDTDQVNVYRGQVGNRGPDAALGISAQIVAETGEALAEAVEIGDLDAGVSAQRTFQVECPHPRLYCKLSWRKASGESFSYRTNQLYPADPA